jgi:1-acyl-sn-glycerol-3-phosphate acyltransferase
MRGKTGAVRLALADGIPLIPMAHWGGQDILPRYGKLSFWPLRRRVQVIVGDPVDIAEFAARPPAGRAGRRHRPADGAIARAPVAAARRTGTREALESRRARAEGDGSP